MINFKEMQDEILNKKLEEIFNKYLNLFRTEIKLPKVDIEKGQVFFRGREKCDTFKVAIDDFDTEIDVPYFKKEIGAPSIEYTSGGRFNRAGTSYLYMTSDLDTSMSEIRLVLNQVFSIAEFQCIKTASYVDVSQINANRNLQELYEILMRPVFGDSNEIYSITQFLSDIFKELDYDGIVYKSTKKEGMNIVCFYPELFNFVIYSERAYKGILDNNEKIAAKPLLDDFKRYPEYRKEMYSFGDDLEKEEEFNYILDKIAFEDEQNFANRVKEINSATPMIKQRLLNQLVIDFRKTFLKRNAYQLRGAYYINNKQINIGIFDLLTEKAWHKKN
jgi:RES domain.